MRADSFQPIVSKYLHQIVASVQQAKMQTGAASAHGAAAQNMHSQETSLLPRPGDKMVVVSDQIRLLAKENTALRNIRYAGSEGWFILIKPFDQPDIAENEFMVGGLLVPDLPTYFFISAAYKAILQRMVDADGLTNYMRLFSDGRLAHAAFLAVLAECKEARRSKNIFFLAPREIVLQSGVKPKADQKGDMVSVRTS